MDEAMDFTVKDKPMDLSTVEGPIDLTTIKRPNLDQDEQPKHPHPSCFQIADIRNLYPGENSINKDENIPPLESKSTFVPGSLLSQPIGNDTRLKDSRIKLASPMTSPMTSPIMYSPPLIQAPTSPAHTLGASLPSLHRSPEPDSSIDEQASNRRYMSASRPFNILAKKLIGDIDCPPRPGHREGPPKSSGGTGRKDANESDAAYRERRSKNNLAARRSRDKRKKKCDLLTERTATCKQQSLEILKEIATMQEVLLNKGYKQPIPFQDEIKFISDALYMFS